MSLKVKITGVNATIKGLNRKIANIEEIVEEQVTESTYSIAEMANNEVPVNLGGLKNSITPTVIKDKGVIKGQVVVNKDYAAYVEFGTGGLVNVPSGLEDYASQFKGAGIKQVNLPARPFLFPAFFKETKTLKEELIKKINGA